MHSSLVSIAWLLPFVCVPQSADAEAQSAVTVPAFQKGFTLGGWSREDYRGSQVVSQLQALRTIGVEWLALTPRWLQARRDSVTVAPDPEFSPSDESLQAVIRSAQALGLRVFLKPQIDRVGPGWRGEIAFRAEHAWAAWFRSYTAFLSHYARLAEAERVDLLSGGVELDATRHWAEEWRTTIAAVRTIYSGPLIYSANWDRERDITWWDESDYAGVDTYFPLSANPEASVDEIAASRVLPSRAALSDEGLQLIAKFLELRDRGRRVATTRSEHDQRIWLCLRSRSARMRRLIRDSS